MNSFATEKHGEATLTHILRGDPAYPRRLLPHPAMPADLYVAGSLPKEALPSAAIVGARRCSAYGRSEARRLGRALAERGVQIISGMAYGIDANAQEGALEGGGSTFAVLGCGADRCYPESSRGLYRAILRGGGGIISEYPPGTPPLPHHFPVRNRIISALADIVIVVEARRKSGSLITASYALEQGKTVYAVPGRNLESLSEGCNELIAQGAGIATGPAPILEELGLLPSGKTAGAEETGLHPVPRHLRDRKEVMAVYGVLERNGQTLEEIAARTALPPEQAGAALMQLCIAGCASEPVRGYYQIF